MDHKTEHEEKMNQNIEISIQDLVDCIIDQRNAALNELSNKNALIKKLMRLLDEKNEKNVDIKE